MGYVADAVVTYLAGAGLGLTAGTNLVDSAIPLSPPDCVVVLEQGGAKPYLTFGAGTGVGAPAARKPNVRILARGATRDWARSKIESVWGKLCRAAGFSDGTLTVLYAEPASEPRVVTPDRNDRFMYEATFVLIVRSA